MTTPTTSKARRVLPDGHRDGVMYRQQYVRCGKAGCRKCPPHGPGHGPYWYGFYWDYRQRTRSFYVGKTLPAGVEVCIDTDTIHSNTPDDKEDATPAQAP